MYNITNIEELGTDYTVSDIGSGEVLKTIQVITYSEILEAIMGEYTDEFESYSDYLKKSIALMTGFVPDLYKTLWYATSEEEVVLAEIIQYAILNGYDKIILEHLEDLE